MLAREGVQQNLTEYQYFVKCYASESHFSQELVAPTCALPLCYTSPFPLRTLTQTCSINLGQSLPASHVLLRLSETFLLLR